MTALGGAAPPVEVSVVVPVLNAERHLDACLEGLLSQDFPAGAYEIILVDNGSTDASVEIARRHPRVRVFRESRPGAYAARNRGVAESTGELIAFTDPDCVAREHWLRNLAAAMAEPNVGIVLGCRKPAGASLAAAMIADYENEKADYVTSSGARELYYGYTNNMAVRRKLFEAVGPFVDRPRGADTILVRRAVEARSGRVARYRPDAVVTHLELDGIASYYRKVYLYGRHRARNQPIAFTRPLRFAQRIAVLRRVVRHGRYRPGKALLLGLVLAGGLIAWQLGTWSQRVGASRASA